MKGHSPQTKTPIFWKVYSKNDANIYSPCDSCESGTRPLDFVVYLCHTMSMKNTHIEHPEDSILNGDLSCLDWFIAGGNLSLKIDGSPAIVWGTDPDTGKFFVGTKSVFNKKKIKICYTVEDIYSLYDVDTHANVIEILAACLKYLPRTEKIYQGDFIGFGGTDEYKPNTIIYKFPAVVRQVIIIAPHTIYEVTNHLRDAVAFPDTSIWNDTDFVKYVKPKVYGQESFADVREMCDYARQMSTLVNYVSDKEAAKIKQQLNACIREQRDINPEEFECDHLLIEFWKLVKSIKEDCLFFCHNDGPAAYINQDRIDAEGYVLTNQFGMFKLVNRESFSYANFTLAKTW